VCGMRAALDKWHRQFRFDLFPLGLREKGMYDS
jgi:hypothetical protein